MMTIEQKDNNSNSAADDLLAESLSKESRRVPGVIAIWDAWTRLFHWSLAVSVLFLLFSGETGFKFYEWHRHVGEFVLLLICFRIMWGFVGSGNVRFKALLQNPLSAFKHLGALFSRKVHDERGHNAAGSWAILIMLVLLLTQALTGLFIADEDEFVEGAFYGQLSADTSEFLYRIHHQNAELLMVLVGAHVAMILLYWLYAGKNLIVPMLSGRMRWTSTEAAPAVKFQSWWIGLVCFLIAMLGVAWLLGWSVPFIN